MIFNTWAYFLFFLVPSAILFRLSPPRHRPWVIVAGSSAFFLYFSYTELGGIIPAACLGIFPQESITSRFYRPKSWFCWVGVAQAIVLLFIFKYWNFVAGLFWFRAPEQHYWDTHFCRWEFLSSRSNASTTQRIATRARRRPGTSASIWHSFCFSL